MTDAEWTRANTVLNDLLDAAPDDATAWLQERYADEPEFRANVASLYRAYRTGAIRDHEGAATWLQFSASDASTKGRSYGTPPSDAPLPGSPVPGQETDSQPPRHGQQTVGRYRLIEKIGDGGMGVVYRAERSDGAFERPVAVKLLRRIVSAGTERRFRAERQVLASLDHPNIAGLIDGGVTEEGRLYLVMELVDGTPITEYARSRSLTASERVELLTQVIDAVYAAHQNLVVHRDLKPSNVLVTETDAGPQVKLLDFGIAKILDEALPVTRPVTQTGHALMTPAYAAPEQIKGGEISTATDTYQLGVLAYELLTGRPPLVDGETERRQIERRILETS
ncbi:MAG: protein kinase, partial [Bacteroidetes bacterium]|nr:protein kinase [Bacteroidota bacterium]